MKKEEDHATCRNMKSRIKFFDTMECACNNITSSDLNKYFVKFVPYNANTLSALINNTIKFSTAYEFNDFNELRYMARSNRKNEEEYRKKIKKIFEKNFKKIEFKYDLLKYSSFSGRYSKQKIKDFEEEINNYTDLDKFFENHSPLIEEYLVFSNVGMFCVSSLEVFENEAAQLMFAHYGDGLKGLALIYEVSQVALEKITYADCDYKNFSGCVGDIKRIFRWTEKKFKKDDLDDFLLKLKMWDYEKESRFFSEPGIRKLDELGIHLNTVLFTPKFDKNSIEVLRKIIKSYEKEVSLEEIYVSTLFGKPSQFKIVSQKLSVADWLRKK